MATVKAYDNIAAVEVGGGAVMFIVNPQSLRDGGVEWRLRYAPDEEAAMSGATLIDSYDYLLSDNITMREATGRLRKMRKARAALKQAGV